MTEPIDTPPADPASPPASPPRKTTRWIVLVVVGFGLIALQGCCGIIVVPGLDMLFFLAIGWVYFLAKTAPHVTVRWDMVPLALIYCAILIVGGHFFLRWLYGELTKAPAPDAPAASAPWRWQWTFSAFGLVIFLFFSGIASIGIVHEFTWIVRSPRPLYRSGTDRANRVKCASNLRQIGQGFMLYAHEHKNRYPADFAALIAECDLNPEVFICPSSNDDKATGADLKAILADFAKPHRCSYIYSPNMNAGSPAEMVLAYEDPANHDNAGMNVMYNDGHVEWTPGELALRMFQELKAGQNPPPCNRPTTQP